jgi:hypothetical protein
MACCSTQVASFNPFCAYNCNKYMAKLRYSCSVRHATARAHNWNFYSNEQPRDEAPGPASSAILCPQLVNVITLRDPYAHMVSLVGQMQMVYTYAIIQLKLQRKLKIAWDYDLVADVAPAVVGGYSLRTLLGRSWMCGKRLRQRLGLRELRAGQALLSQYDAVLTLGRDELNDPVLQAGLGWSRMSLGMSHQRSQ